MCLKESFPSDVTILRKTYPVWEHW